MATIDFEKYYAMENGAEAKDQFDEALIQRLMDVGVMYQAEIGNKGLRYVDIADLFGISVTLISKFPTRGIMFRTDELEKAFNLIFPTKGIDEILFGQPHAMALPVMAEYFLSCVAEVSENDMPPLELFMKSLPAEKTTPTERCRALFSDRRKESYVRDPFQTAYFNRRVSYIKAGKQEIDSNLKNAIKMSLYVDCSMDYLATQSCEHVVFYHEKDPQKTPISEKEQYLLSLFFPLSEEDKIRACTKAAMFAISKAERSFRRHQWIKAQKEKMSEQSAQAEQPVEQPAEPLDDELCEKFAEWSGNLDEKGLLKFCCVPRTRTEIIQHLNIASRDYALHKFLYPLVKVGAIRMSYPEKPKTPKQRFATVTKDELTQLMAAERQQENNSESIENQ